MSFLILISLNTIQNIIQLLTDDPIGNDLLKCLFLFPGISKENPFLFSFLFDIILKHIADKFPVIKDFPFGFLHLFNLFIFIIVFIELFLEFDCPHVHQVIKPIKVLFPLVFFFFDFFLLYFQIWLFSFLANFETFGSFFVYQIDRLSFTFFDSFFVFLDQLAKIEFLFISSGFWCKGFFYLIFSFQKLDVFLDILISHLILFFLFIVLMLRNDLFELLNLTLDLSFLFTNWSLNLLLNLFKALVISTVVLSQIFFVFFFLF